MDVAAKQDEPRPTLVISTRRADVTSAVIILNRGDDAYIRPIAEAIAAGEPVPLSGSGPVDLYRFDGDEWVLVAGPGLFRAAAIYDAAVAATAEED
jgi:hypothetical protein